MDLFSESQMILKTLWIQIVKRLYAIIRNIFKVSRDNNYIINPIHYYLSTKRKIV